VLIGLVGNLSNPTLQHRCGRLRGSLSSASLTDSSMAPVVTHVGQSDLAGRIGANSGDHDLSVPRAHRSRPPGRFFGQPALHDLGAGASISSPGSVIVTASLGILFLAGKLLQREYDLVRFGARPNEQEHFDPAYPAFAAVIAGFAGVFGLPPSALGARGGVCQNGFRYSRRSRCAMGVRRRPPSNGHAAGRFDRKKIGAEAVQTRRVMVLYPRPSSAYDIAILGNAQSFSRREESTKIEFTGRELRPEGCPGATKRFPIPRKKKQIRSDLCHGPPRATAWLYDHYRGGVIPGRVGLFERSGAARVK